MRKFENLQYGDANIIKESLEVLANPKTEVKEYREAFMTLGLELGKVLASQYCKIPASKTMLVCASEDADWLATGVEKGYNKGELKKAVYWSSREIVYEDNGKKIEQDQVRHDSQSPHQRIFHIKNTAKFIPHIFLTSLINLSHKKRRGRVNGPCAHSI